MRPRVVFLALFVSLAFLLGISAYGHPRNAILGAAASPTPTFDPLIEPPLPPKPTELELGKNLYWHWCMPCHGDRAQGLTDEFRMIWEEDHQDCWARGCHGGLPRDEGFPIPTLVPSLITDDQLAQFEGLQQFSDYLKATHPPQSPGSLSSEQYQAIAAYVFDLNNRSTSLPASQSLSLTAIIPVAAILPLAAVLAFLLQKKENKPQTE